MDKPILPFCFHTVDLFLFVSFSITPKSASSNSRPDLCVPPSHVYRAAAFPCLQSPLSKGLPCSSLSWMTIPLNTNLLLLSYSVSIPRSCPSYQFHILKLQQKNEPHTSENLRLLGNNHLAPVHCKNLLHSILLHSSLGFHPVIPPAQEHSSPRQPQSSHSCTQLTGRPSDSGAGALQKLLGYRLWQ